MRPDHDPARPVKRLAALILLVMGVPTALVFGLAASDGGGDYRVRAIFDNASAAVEGEDVKVAGAKVGVIDDMEVTRDNKAAITLKIEEPGFDGFRRDAECTIRPQSLIGEKFVECSPGSAGEPELRRIPDGEPGAGSYDLPLERTSSPVDLDLVNNTFRKPYRERFSLLINEFGTALAGRGEELNEVIHRSNPALRETSEVLKLLAEQKQVLGDLARDSDAALAPIARERERVSHFIETANETAEATAERREDIERSIERLPRLLPELRATLDELGVFADEMTPVLRDLGVAAPDLNRFVLELGPFSRAATPSLESLGEATDVAGPALDASRPLLEDIRDFAIDLRPVSRDLDDLTRSLDRTGGIERVMDYLFFQVLAINGFDGLSHYLRAGLLVNTCSFYGISKAAGCSSNFTDTPVLRASGVRRDEMLERTRRVLADPPKAGRGKPLPPANPFERLFAKEDPAVRKQRAERIERLQKDAESPPGPAGDPAAPVLDYLLGNGE